MGQQIVKGGDGRDYVELPGGVRFPADELKEQQPTYGSTIGKWAYKILTPEVVGGASALLAPETGGMSLAIPPLVGAGTSLVRDYMAGQRDPKTMASDALVHAGWNAVPGLAGVATRGVMNMGKGALDAAGMIPKVGIAAKLAKMLGLGAEQAPAAAQASSGLGSMLLPSGAKVVSSQGLKELVQKSIELENSGAPKATVAALDAIIQQVQQALANPGAADVLAKAGMPITTMAAQKAAQAAALASRYGRNVTNTLRGLMGAGSVGYEELR